MSVGINRAERKYLLLLIILSSVIYFFAVTTPLTDGDTGYYGVIARNIIRTGDWQSLRYDNPENRDPNDKLGKDFVDKPPVSIWPIAISYKLFGVSDWSTKAWHSLLAVCCIVLTYLFAKELFSVRAAFWGGLVFLTSALMFYAGQVPQQDVPVVFMTLFSLFSFFRFLRTDKLVYFYLVWLGMGLNLLTRGLPGIAFIAGPIIVFFILRKFFKAPIDQKSPDRKLIGIHCMLGFIVFLVTGCGWYLLEYLRRGPAFLDPFIGSGLRRYASPMFSESPGSPIWVEFPYLIVALLPWSSFLWYAIKLGWKDRKHSGGGILLILAWFFVAFGLALAIKWRVIRYLLPCLPPLAILIGRVIDGIWAEPVETDSLRAFRFSAIANLIIVIPVFLALLSYSLGLVNDDAQKLYLPAVMPFLVTILIGITAFCIFIFMKKPRWAVLLLVSFTFVSYLFLLTGVRKNIDLINPWPELAREISTLREPGEDLIYLENQPNPFITFAVGEHPHQASMEGLITEINEGRYETIKRIFLFSNSLIDTAGLQNETAISLDIKLLKKAPLGQSAWMVSF